MRGRKTQDLLNRFLNKIEMRKPSQCWQWLGSFFPTGYGQFAVDKHNIRAPRLAYELFRGPIPMGLNVLHRCDNPGCVNPAHLFLGTPRDNTRDTFRKGRRTQNTPEFWRNHPELCPYGERNPNAKLRMADVTEIRRLYKDGEISKSKLGRRFRVSATAICDIIHKKTWKK